MSKLDLPPYTCPEIDELIKSLSRVEKLVRFSNFSDIDEANDAIKEVEWEVSGWESKLENLRKSNSSLREFAESEHEDYEDLKNSMRRLIE